MYAVCSEARERLNSTGGIDERKDNPHRILTSCVLLAVFCSGLSAAENTVGSFNLEWFGHGFKPRTDEDITRMANYIRSLEVDILACQEIRPNGDTSNNGTPDWGDKGVRWVVMGLFCVKKLQKFTFFYIN